MHEHSLRQAVLPEDFIISSEALLERKRAGKGVGADKGKFSESEVAAMENVE